MRVTQSTDQMVAPSEATAGLTTPTDNSRPVHSLIWPPMDSRHGLRLCQHPGTWDELTRKRSSHQVVQPVQLSHPHDPVGPAALSPGKKLITVDASWLQFWLQFVLVRGGSRTHIRGLRPAGRRVTRTATHAVRAIS